MPFALNRGGKALPKFLDGDSRAVTDKSSGRVARFLFTVFNVSPGFENGGPTIADVAGKTQFRRSAVQVEIPVLENRHPALHQHPLVVWIQTDEEVPVKTLFLFLDPEQRRDRAGLHQADLRFRRIERRCREIGFNRVGAVGNAAVWRFEGQPFRRHRKPASVDRYRVVRQCDRIQFAPLPFQNRERQRALARRQAGMHENPADAPVVPHVAHRVPEG